jgi:transposase-like protein
VAVVDIVPVPGESFEQTLTAASPDLLREMIRAFAQKMMDAEVEVACGAGYGEVSPARVNSRNGYRPREWDTRAGTVELAIPKLRHGSYFPSFLEHRRRAERALASVVATSYLLGVSTRRVEKLAASLGVTGLSKSQVSAMAAELDELVEGFRSRRLDGAPYTFVWIDALTQKVREGGRTVNVHCLVATGVNADGHREILGVDVTSSEDGAGWLAFLRGLVARGLSGVALVTSDDHAGLVSAIASVLPGAAWQRCRTHYHRNLLTRVPKSAQPWVSTWSGRSSSSPTPPRCAPSTPRSSPPWRPSCPRPPPTWTRPGTTSWPSPPSPARSGGRSGPTTRRNGSTRRSGAAPTSSASSRAATPSSASSAPCSRSRTMNGQNHAVTWDRKYSPPAGEQRIRRKAVKQELPVILN